MPVVVFIVRYYFPIFNKLCMPKQFDSIFHLYMGTGRVQNVLPHVFPGYLEPFLSNLLRI